MACKTLRCISNPTLQSPLNHCSVPVQCSSYKWFSFVPRNSSTLCPAGTVPLQGMSSLTHSPRSRSNVTCSVELSSQFSPAPFPVSAKIICSFLYRKCSMKKKLLNTISIYLFWEHKNGVSQVLHMWNLEFTRGTTKASQCSQFSGSNAMMRALWEESKGTRVRAEEPGSQSSGTEFCRTKLFNCGRAMVSFLKADVKLVIILNWEPETQVF